MPIKLYVWEHDKHIFRVSNMTMDVAMMTSSPVLLTMKKL